MKLKTSLFFTALLGVALYSPIGATYDGADEEIQFNKGFAAVQKGDYKSAFKLWKPLADKGSMSAQFNIAVMYFEGKGVKQDFKQAAKYYQKAANQGDDSAQVVLSALYFGGMGVKPDTKKAKYWANKACQNGNPRGCDNYRIFNQAK